MSDESIKEPHVRVMAEYIDSELNQLYEIDAVRCAGLVDMTQEGSCRSHAAGPCRGMSPFQGFRTEPFRRHILSDQACPIARGSAYFHHKQMTLLSSRVSSRT